jgi:hypothetical protein
MKPLAKFKCTIFLFISCFLSIKTSAQKLAVKPFWGYQQTIIDNSTNDAKVFTFNEKSIEPTWGVMVSYQVRPKFGVELGWKKSPLTMDLDWKDPNTEKQAGFYHYSVSNNNFMALGNYSILNNPRWLHLNIIGGVELLRPNTGQGKAEKYIDTSFMDVVESNRYMNSKKMLLLNMGIAAVFLVHKTPYVELRVMSGLGFYQYTSFSFTVKRGQSFYENQRSTNSSYLSVALFVNMSAILLGPLR